MADRYPMLLRRASGLGRWARVAALGRFAGQAWLRGDAAACFAALGRQREVARGHPAAEVTALTSSALLTAASGHPVRARRDLDAAEARLGAAGIAALAPQWEQAALVCDWTAGDRAAALARTERLATMPPPVPAAVTLGLRAEVLRASGRTDAAREVATRLDAAVPAALAAWALAGLDDDPATALARLRAATEAAWRDDRRGLIPLLLHRTARIAADAGEPEIVAEAHAGFARLEPAGPLARVLAGLTEARATRSAEAARQAHRLAESAGLGILTPDCLRVLNDLGDPPVHPAPEPRDPASNSATSDSAIADDPTPSGLTPGSLTPNDPTPNSPTPGSATPNNPTPNSPTPGSPTPNNRAPNDPAPGSLTPRERELAALVRAGRTNRQIAETMHLSVKSVEAYLTRVYAKTGCESRVALALAVAEGRINAR